MSKGTFRVFMLFILLAAASCSTSKYQDGFSYRPAHQGPDVNGREENGQAPPAAPIATNAAALPASAVPTPTANETQTTSLTQGLQTVSPAASVDLALLSRLAAEQAVATESTPADAAKVVHTLAENYAAEKQITLTEKQQQQLDRYASKLHKKQQKKAEVDWGPNNNMEIFTLAAAGVGLVVGLFGVGLGWFVFVVAALAYLYFKLLA